MTLNFTTLLAINRLYKAGKVLCSFPDAGRYPSPKFAIAVTTIGLVRASTVALRPGLLMYLQRARAPSPSPPPSPPPFSTASPRRLTKEESASFSYVYSSSCSSLWCVLDLDSWSTLLSSQARQTCSLCTVLYIINVLPFLSLLFCSQCSTDREHVTFFSHTNQQLWQTLAVFILYGTRCV